MLANTKHSIPREEVCWQISNILFPGKCASKYQTSYSQGSVLANIIFSGKCAGKYYILREVCVKCHIPKKCANKYCMLRELCSQGSGLTNIIYPEKCTDKYSIPREVCQQISYIWEKC